MILLSPSFEVLLSYISSTLLPNNTDANAREITSALNFAGAQSKVTDLIFILNFFANCAFTKQSSSLFFTSLAWWNKFPANKKPPLENECTCTPSIALSSSSSKNPVRKSFAICVVIFGDKDANAGGATTMTFSPIRLFSYICAYFLTCFLSLPNHANITITSLFLLLSLSASNVNTSIAFVTFSHRMVEEDHPDF